MAQFLSGGGVECGPTTALKNVSGRLGQDFSLHQDRLISTPNVAGPSRPSTRAAPQSSRSGAVQQPARRPFDLSALRHHLAPAPPAIQPAPSEWARAFSQRTQSTQTRAWNPSVQQNGVSAAWQDDFQRHHMSPSPSANPFFHQVERPVPAAPWQSHFHPMMPAPVPFHQPDFMPQPFHPGYTLPPTPVAVQTAIAPDTERAASAPPASAIAPAQPLTESQSILADTAKVFVTDLESSDLLQNNPKLANSQFVELLRGLGREEVVVQEGSLPQGLEEVGEGAKFVERAGAGANWAADFADAEPATLARQTAQQQALHPGVTSPAPLLQRNAVPSFISSPLQKAADSSSEWEKQFQDQEAIVHLRQASSQRRKSVHFNEEAHQLGSGVPNTLDEAIASTTAVPGAQTSWEDGFYDMGDFDEAAFAHFNGEMGQAHSPRIGVGALEGWGSMQQDWDAFQSAESSQRAARGQGTGDQVEHYLFQSQNPYAQQMRSVAPDSPTLKGVLELEAAVQDDPTDHEAWYALGLKQQENEREDQAILALGKVVQLDPDYRPAYLALAVSYTNEGELEAAHNMLGHWVDLGEGIRMARRQAQYSAVTRQLLVDRLLAIANKKPDEVDADIQIALGVLFNSSEEYDKAEDCFLAALSARPDDWLLYNRIGATLSNSGRSQEALGFYHKALSLHPNFVRALFNLSISHFNLTQYSQSAQRVLDALRLQQADVSEGYSFAQRGAGSKSKGVGDETLWNALHRACLHLGRKDLAELATARNLNGFPMDLEMPLREQEILPVETM